MAYIPTSEDIALLSQHSREIYSRIDILNKDFKTIDSVQGVTLDGTVSIDAESDIRRTYNSTIHLADNNYITAENALIWMDKYVQIYLGVKGPGSQKPSWYSLGLFKFCTNGFNYSQTDKTLSVSCVDLTATLDGTLSGELTGLSTEISEGETIREVLVRLVHQLGGYDKYLISYADKKVPYDLKYGAASSIYSIVKEVRDLFYLYETFFDGRTFVCQEVPTCEDDPVFLPAEVLDPLVVSESTNSDFSVIRNCTEVWGKVLTATYSAGSSTLSEGVYALSVEQYKQRQKSRVSFIPPESNPASALIQINEEEACPLVDEEGRPLAAGTMVGGKLCVVCYEDGKFFYLGQSQAHAMVMLVGREPTPEEIAEAKRAEGCDNLKFIVLPESPFTIEKIGRKNQVLQGGEYDHITSDALAMQRAEYENWKSTRLTDSVSIEALLIPWLDVNKKVSYTPRYDPALGTLQYIVKHIEFSLKSGTMTVSMCRFFPYYPYIIDKL